MILPLYLACLIVGALFLWCAFFIVAWYGTNETEYEYVNFVERHSVTDNLLDKAELGLEHLVVATGSLLRAAALGFIGALIPIVRRATKGIEGSLLKMSNALRGKHDISASSRDKGSSFVRDIKGHATETRKIGGAIHEDGNVVN